MSEHPPILPINQHMPIHTESQSSTRVPSDLLNLSDRHATLHQPTEPPVPEVVRRVERDPRVLASPPHRMSDLLANQAGEQLPVSEPILERAASAHDLYELWRDWYETAGAGRFPRRYSYSPSTHVHIPPRQGEELGDAQPGRLEERNDEAVTPRRVLDDQGDLASGRRVGDATAARREAEARVASVVRGDAQVVEDLFDDVQVAPDRLAGRALLDEGRYEALEVLEGDPVGCETPEREAGSHSGLDGLQVAGAGGGG